MSRAIHLFSWFMTGCIASSLLSWMASVHPALTRAAVGIYILFAVAWCLCWLLDDSIAPFLKVRNLGYYSALIGAAAAVILGGLAVWLTNG